MGHVVKKFGRDRVESHALSYLAKHFFTSSVFEEIWLSTWSPKILKVHKHEIFLNFFLPKSNPYMPLINFRKKIRLVCFDFRQNFEVRTFTRWLSIRGTKFFLRNIPKFFFFKIFTMVLLDGLLDGFSKFWFFIIEICILIRDFWVIFENYCMRMLSIRGNDFIACWAY
jgi:hypothetical protein